MSLPMVFVQARMASRRFPGKVLAPLAGRPVIEHVLNQIMVWTLPIHRKRQIVVCVSDPDVDWPLIVFLERAGYQVFYPERADADDVVSRFQECLEWLPCERFFRVCGDSPLLDPTLFDRFLEVAGRPDLVTNVFPRTFPKGQSLELIRTDTFLKLDSASLTPKQREHPTKFFYDNEDQFHIVNLLNKDFYGDDVAVDTVEDLRRIEGML